MQAQPVKTQLIDVEHLDQELQAWPGTALTPAEKRYYAAFAVTTDVVYAPWGAETVEPGMCAWLETEYAIRIKKSGIRKATAWLWWEVRELTDTTYRHGVRDQGITKSKGIITPTLSNRGDDSWGRLTRHGDRVL